MNFGRFCESEFWMAKVAMNRMSKGNTFYGRKAHITSSVGHVHAGPNVPLAVLILSYGGINHAFGRLDIVRLWQAAFAGY